MSQLSHKEMFKAYDWLKNTAPKDGVTRERLLEDLYCDTGIQLSISQLNALCKSSETKIDFKRKRSNGRGYTQAGEDRCVVLSEIVLQILRFMETELDYQCTPSIKQQVQQIRNRTRVDYLRSQSESQQTTVDELTTTLSSLMGATNESN